MEKRNLDINLMRNILIIDTPGVQKAQVFEYLVDKQARSSGLMCFPVLLGTERIGIEMGALIHKRDRVADERLHHKRLIASVGQDAFTQRVGRYGIDVQAIEELCIQQAEKPIMGNDLLYLGPLGALQFKAEAFTLLADRYLDAPNACIMTVSDCVNLPYGVRRVQKRNDVLFVHLTPNNCQSQVAFILGFLKEIEKARRYVTKPENFTRNGSTVEIGLDEKRYLVDLRGGRERSECTCAFRRGNPKYGLCAHIIAAQALYPESQ